MIKELLPDNYLDRKVSLFKNFANADKPTFITIAEFLQDVKSGRYKQYIEVLRSNVDDKTIYGELKKQLPAITLSAYCSNRIKENSINEKLIYHTGLLQIDIDKIEGGTKEIKNQLIADKYTFFCFDSPGGLGLKVGIKINIDSNNTADVDSFPQLQLNCLNSAIEYYKKNYNLSIDKTVKDVFRLFCISDDPELHLNENSEIFAINNIQVSAKLHKPEITTSSQIIKNTNLNEKIKSYKKDTILKMLSTAKEGERHEQRLKAGRLTGGLIAGGVFTESEILPDFYRISDSIAVNGFTNDSEIITIKQALEDGKRDPITFDNIQAEYNDYKRHKSHVTNEIQSGAAIQGISINKDTGEITTNKIESPTLHVNSDNISILSKIERFIESQYLLRRNTVKTRIQYKANDGKWQYINDKTINEIWRQANHRGIKASKTMIENIIDSDFVVDYDPFFEYKNNLPDWDYETDFIQRIADKVPVVDEDLERWRDYFRRWFVLNYGQALSLTTNLYLPVLIGRQGAGKSRFTSKLIPDILGGDYYKTSKVNNIDKDSFIDMAEHYLIELDELEDLHKTAKSELKQYLTMNQINCRKPYGHHDEFYKRVASFFGSSNKSDILTDETGNRRFMLFNVKDNCKIDYDTPFNLDYAFSQAKILFESGHNFHLTVDDLESHNKYLQKFEVQTVAEELLLKHFEPAERNDKTADKLQTTEIANELNKHYKYFDPVKQSRSLGGVLKKHNFIQVDRTSPGIKGTRKAWLVKMLNNFPY